MLKLCLNLKTVRPLTVQLCSLLKRKRATGSLPSPDRLVRKTLYYPSISHKSIHSRGHVFGKRVARVRPEHTSSTASQNRLVFYCAIRARDGFRICESKA